MSTRKTTLFYAVLIAVASLAVGMVIASQWGLPQASSAQTVNVPAVEQRAAERPDRRADVPQHRQGAEPDGRQHPDRRRARAARELTEFFGGGDDLLQRFFGGQVPPQRPRHAAAAPAPRRRGRRPARRHRHRLHHRQGRLHPHQQPRRRRGRRHPRQPVRRRPHRELRGEGRRPRRADRHRADPADRDAGGAAAGSEVRRLRADAAGRLGHGDRQPVRPRATRSPSA